jgi:hypothetical protein
MLRCLAKESFLKQLGELRAGDPEFLRKFEEIVRKLKEHITSGHPRPKHYPIGRACAW